MQKNSIELIQNFDLWAELSISIEMTKKDFFTFDCTIEMNTHGLVERLEEVLENFRTSIIN